MIYLLYPCVSKIMVVILSLIDNHIHFSVKGNVKYLADGYF